LRELLHRLGSAKRLPLPIAEPCPTNILSARDIKSSLRHAGLFQLVERIGLHGQRLRMGQIQTAVLVGAIDPHRYRNDAARDRFAWFADPLQYGDGAGLNLRFLLLVGRGMPGVLG